MNLAIIDPGVRKARFLLQVHSYLEPECRCFYYSRRRIVRGWVESAGFVPYPQSNAPPSPQFDLSDDELRSAIGSKELSLRPQSALRSARRLLAEISGFLDACRADAVLLWNGSSLQVSLATFVARRRGMPILFVEHGYLPGTLQLDLQGVNYASSVTTTVLRGEAFLPPDPELDAALDQEIACYKAGRPMRVMEPCPPRHLRTDAFSRARHAGNALFKQWYRRRLWRRGRALGLDQSPLPERFILVPLQVQKDSQLILHSPLIGNDMGRLLRGVQRAAEQVDPQLRVVAKLHPQEQPHVQKRNLKLLSEFPAIQFVSKVAMRDLLSRTAAVVTINSTVGFEAFLYEKPVIALGRNFYTAPPLVEVVTAEHEIAQALTRALNTPVASEHRRAFMRYIYSRFLVHGSYSDYSERSLRAVADRIRELLARASQVPAQLRPAPAVVGHVVRPHGVHPSVPAVAPNGEGGALGSAQGSRALGECFKRFDDA